jgi:invasion protein IalB
MAYFSINGGQTQIAPYNNSTNGDDYGDWATTCKYLQDAEGCNLQGGLNIANDGGVEIVVLGAVGYNLTEEGQSLSAATVPEPGTIGMVAAGLGLLAGFARRRSQRH